MCRRKLTSTPTKLFRRLLVVVAVVVVGQSAGQHARGQGAQEAQPDFGEPIGNHTVALGRDAQLACKILRLGHFRTAWLRVEDKGILTIHNNIISRNYRLGLINADDEARGASFILTIRNVQASDKVSLWAC